MPSPFTPPNSQTNVPVTKYRHDVNGIIIRLSDTHCLHIHHVFPIRHYPNHRTLYPLLSFRCHNRQLTLWPFVSFLLYHLHPLVNFRPCDWWYSAYRLSYHQHVASKMAWWSDSSLFEVDRLFLGEKQSLPH
jgi:hypothetical protein